MPTRDEFLKDIPAPPPPDIGAMLGSPVTGGEDLSRSSLLKGMESFADMIVATALTFLEGLIPIYGSNSSKGEAIIKACGALKNVFSSEDEKRALAQQGMQLLGGAKASSIPGNMPAPGANMPASGITPPPGGNAPPPGANIPAPGVNIPNQTGGMR